MKRLRKVVLKTPLIPQFRGLFDLCESYELIQIHRLSENMIFGTNRLRFKDPQFHPSELRGKFGIESIEVIAEDKKRNEYICIIKHHWEEELQQLFSDSNLMIDPPIIWTGNQLIISFISDRKSIDKLIQDQEERYRDEFKILSLTSVVPDVKNLSLLLTERQKEIMSYAVEKGYFENPRKVDSLAIAKHFGISQSATTTHLRKILKTLCYAVFK